MLARCFSTLNRTVSQVFFPRVLGLECGWFCGSAGDRALCDGEVWRTAPSAFSRRVSQWLFERFGGKKCARSLLTPPRFFFAVAHRLIDDADEVLGLPRTHEETRCTLMGGARVVYRSWTKAKDATRVFHSALLTVNGMLCAKLSWQWMDDDREAAVLEVYRVPLWTLARRVGMAVDAFAVLQFLAAFCIHYGPKGERYSLQDFSSALDAPSLGPTGPRSVVRTFESPRSSDRTLGLDVARIASDDVHCPDSPHAAPEE